MSPLANTGMFTRALMARAGVPDGGAMRSNLSILYSLMPGFALA